uniref:Secreted protein n=1 Tax=Knipowitschia caucasica TaxID=637954 RepID=A0AAV2L922_KNICA
MNVKQRYWESLPLLFVLTVIRSNRSERSLGGGQLWLGGGGGVAVRAAPSTQSTSPSLILLQVVSPQE